MAGRVRLIQNSFTSGELSPRLAGRTDVEYYFNGAETIENWIILPQGGLKTRPGLHFIAEVKGVPLTESVRLIPFQFNDQQSYIIEAGRDPNGTGFGYMRFYRDTARITVADTDAAITNGAFPSDITGWTTRSSGTGTAAWNTGNLSTGVLRLVSGAAGNEGRAYQQVSIGVPYRSSVHVLRFRLTQGSVVVRIGTTVGGAEISSTSGLKTGWHTIEFNPSGNASVYIEFEGGASATADVDDVVILDNTPLEIQTPYRAAGLDPFEIQFDQSADIMWLTHKLVKPQKLSRRGHRAWSINDYTPTNDPFTSATLFPRAVAFWRSRLWFAGTDSGPNEFWATQVDDFDNLNPGTSQDDEAINGVVAGGHINVIRTLSGLDKQLFVGTYGSEMFIKGDTSGKVTPATVNNNPATEHGVSSLRPVKASGYLLFLQRSHRKIRQLTYDFNTDAFVAPDLLLLSEHLAGRRHEAGLHPIDTIEDLAYSEDLEPLIWGVRSDGELLAGSFLPTHKVLGWSRQVTDGEFEAVAVVPHPDGSRDQIWVIVRRTIAGTVRRFVEVFEDDAGYYGQYTLDCALHYNDPSGIKLVLGAVSGTGVSINAPNADGDFTAADIGKQIWHHEGLSHGAIEITAVANLNNATGDVVVDFESTTLPSETGWRRAVRTLAGLDHLEGHTVAILTDGATHPARTVSGGQITLDEHTAQAEVGLPYTPSLVALRPEVAGRGTIQGLAVTRSEVKIRVLDTVTLSVNGQQLPERSAQDNMDEVPPTTTGDIDVAVLGWEEEGKLTITQDTNQPATLLALMSFIWFGDA